MDDNALKSQATNQKTPVASLGTDTQCADWKELRQTILARDKYRCQDCGETCSKADTDIHHVIPRSMGGSDHPANLITLCDGCHAAHHPKLQVALSRRFLERWACRLARWLDNQRTVPHDAESLGVALRLFGLTKFRERQLDVVLSALKGRSVLFVSPTGSGKSLCFQVPGLLRAGVTCVVSPLRALMTDQVVHLQKLKIPSTYINSDLSPEEKADRYALLAKNVFKFAYIAPERFDDTKAKPEDVAKTLALKPEYLVIDEAHCIVKWGKDFRPSYGALGSVRVKLGSPPVLAFTATAGVKTQKAIIHSLGLSDPKVIVLGVDRPNIGLVRLEVKDYAERLAITRSLLALRKHGKVMVFVPTVKTGERIERGLGIPFFHAKLEPISMKEEILGRFTGRLSPRLDQVICTNAFGMGLDVQDVRLVVHWQAPDSVESYLQEFGRAGRDGKPSMAMIFCNSSPENSDKKLLEFMAEKSVENSPLDSDGREALLKAKLELIDIMFKMAVPGRGCLRQQLSDYFCGLEEKIGRVIALWILEIVFGARGRKPKMLFCCDFCNGITRANYLEIARSVLS